MENIIDDQIKDDIIKETKKPLIFCVTPQKLRKRNFMLAEDSGNDDFDGQGCYPDCNPCSPCSPCRPSEWEVDDCYPDCNPCSPCSPCRPGEWDRDDCYPDCNPCSPCSPCRPDER